MNQTEMNKECESCEKIACPKACFNRHVGSAIALGKLLGAIEREDGIKVYVAGMTTECYDRKIETQISKTKKGTLGCKDNCCDYPDCHPSCRVRWYHK